MPEPSGPRNSVDSKGSSFFGKLFSSINVLLSSIIEAGHIKTRWTLRPPAPVKLHVSDNFRRWEFQAKEYVFLVIKADRASVIAMLLYGEAPNIAIDKSILQGDITKRTFRRLRGCFTIDPRRLEIFCQIHGRVQHPGNKLASFIQDLWRLCAEGLTDVTPKVVEQRILQQALGGTRDTSTRRTFLTLAPTSI
ncbi:hypothetical protein EG68_03367 [Paragonimus skrjabini miyazakii]|uniref:Uncharacterized protein n=1 Tax=Paragonimus skrjabini miyazakii TaxID=59628 RepID=A0A8S9Z1Y3_9TREM|nr:hypothetical protein EG68_03367 [Paragonimus skrjabini miyazakii]